MIDQFTLTRVERGFFVGRLMRGGFGAGAAIEADAALMDRERRGRGGGRCRCVKQKPALPRAAYDKQ